MQMLERLSSPDQPQYQTICFTYWLQWHLSKQLKSASEFARQHQIALKGDLPIGTYTPISFQASGVRYEDNHVTAQMTHKPSVLYFSSASSRLAMSMRLSLGLLQN